MALVASSSTAQPAETYVLHDPQPTPQRVGPTSPDARVTSAAVARNRHTEITQALRLLGKEQALVELRILGSPQRTTPSGYFLDWMRLLKAVDHWDGKVETISITLNPVNRALLARSVNHLTPRPANATSDGDVTARDWLFFDFDPCRPAGVSSSEEEHRAALTRAQEMSHVLTTEGWPDGVLFDSGNGAHLLYRINLPNDPPSAQLAQTCLRAANFRFGDKSVAVDESTWNAARLIRLPGTLNRKGESLDERPHRRAQLVSAPSTLVEVPLARLQALAGQQVPRVLLSSASGQTRQARARASSEATRMATRVTPATDTFFDVTRWLADHQIDASGPHPWSNAQGEAQKWLLPVCPFDRSHTNRSAYIIQFSDGGLAAGCHHASCRGRDWNDLRARYESTHDPESAATRPPDLPTPHTSPAPSLTGAPAVILRTTRMADVQSEQVEWLWTGRIPLGKLTIVDGDPGLGKSLLFEADVAARVSVGQPMPDGAPGLTGPAHVLLLNAEDGYGDTLRPRFEAAGGDIHRVDFLDEVEVTGADGRCSTHSWLLQPEDLSLLEAKIYDAGARYVVIDPLMAYLPDAINSWSDQKMRSALRPLGEVAARTKAAIVLVRHLNKSAHGQAIYRGGGSIGIIGAARSGLLIAPDPADSQRRVLAVTKSNVSAPVSSLAYRIEATDLGVPRVTWLGACQYAANELLAAPAPTGATPTRAEEAATFLREQLAHGPRASAEIVEAAHREGISDVTLKRARRAAGVRSKKVGYGADTHWVLALADELISTPHAATVTRDDVDDDDDEDDDDNEEDQDA